MSEPQAPAREARLARLLLAPALLAIGLIALYPMGYTVYLSFQQKVLKLPWLGQHWVGLANYGELLVSTRFWNALVNTVLFTVVSVALETVFGLLAALAIHRAKILTGLTRAAILLPWAVPTVVAAVMWLFLVNPAFGLIPRLLRAFGFTENALVLLAHPLSAWAVIIATDVWKNTPFMTLMLLAGLQVIPQELHEAAAIDGASPWQTFRRVTLPLLTPALLVALVFRTAQAFMVFDHVYSLTAGGPGTATETLAFLAFQALFSDLRFGYGSALCVLMFLGSLIFALLYIRFLGIQVEGGRQV